MILLQILRRGLLAGCHCLYLIFAQSRHNAAPLMHGPARQPEFARQLRIALHA